MTEIEKQKTYFGQIASFYDDQQPVLYRKYDEIHSLMVKMLQFEGHFSVVELGCGTGTLAKMILQAYTSADVTCMDISPEMISIAQEKLAGFEDRADFIVGDLGKVAFRKSYDAAVSIAAIHHLPNPQKKFLFGRLYDDYH
jgi:tRNA (cmo5U34)-methyltransferase